MAIVTLLTDFGARDYYVGAVKGVLASLAPGVTLVDLGHEVDPGDVEAAAFLLAAAAPEFPPGTIHLAVVDPGVGSPRRILAAHDSRGHGLVAPDNGLLTPLLDGARLHAVESAHLFRPGPGATFHGRDRMAPVAAYLARGEPLASLGPSVEDPVRLDLPRPRRGPGSLLGRVAHIDRFGNLVTDLPVAWYEGGPFRVDLGDLSVERWITHYTELAPGEAGLLVGSLGTLELCLPGESLAARTGARRGQDIAVILLG